MDSKEQQVKSTESSPEGSYGPVRQSRRLQGLHPENEVWVPGAAWPAQDPPNHQQVEQDQTHQTQVHLSQNITAQHDMAHEPLIASHVEPRTSNLCLIHLIHCMACMDLEPLQKAAAKISKANLEPQTSNLCKRQQFTANLLKNSSQ
jgi:hypothetical protein